MQCCVHWVILITIGDFQDNLIILNHQPTKCEIFIVEETTLVADFLLELCFSPLAIPIAGHACFDRCEVWLGLRLPCHRCDPCRQCMHQTPSSHASCMQCILSLDASFASWDVNHSHACHDLSSKLLGSEAWL